MNKLRITTACKKIIIAVLIIAFIPIFTFGESINQTISAVLSKETKITWNGASYIPTEADGSIVYPITYNGRTYLPVRFIAEKAGITVAWDNKTNSVVLSQINSDKVSTENSNYIKFNSNEILNSYGSTSVTLPKEIDSRNIDVVVVAKNGKQVSAGVSVDNSNLNITPTDYFLGGETYEIKIITKTNRYSINLKTSKYITEQSYDGDILKIPPNPAKGFNYPYYLYLPTDIEKNKSTKYMIVEPNNTGTVNDNLEVHDSAAHYEIYANGNTAHKVADSLKIPMLKPVFPRPASQGETYTHDLDRNTMLINSGEMKRLDLQLIAMIKDAQQMLEGQGIKVENKVFMNGYSASAKFTNKFTAIHPEMVKAVATGGVNAFTILPTSDYKGTTLNYPIGVADLKQLTGKAFNETEYKKVPQFIYMGENDTNDIIAPGWDSKEGENMKSLARKIIGENMMPDRWIKLQSIYKELGYSNSIQFHTYKGIGHEITNKTNNDVFEFFKANSGNTIQKINPHESGN